MNFTFQHSAKALNIEDEPDLIKQRFRMAIRAGMVCSKEMYDDVKTSIYLRVNCQLPLTEKSNNWSTNLVFGEKTVNIEISAKSCKKRQITDVLIESSSLVPSEFVWKNFLTFASFKDDDEIEKQIQFQGVKRAVLIVYAANRNNAKIDDTVCMEFEPLLNSTIDAAKNYLKETNLQAIDFLRKEKISKSFKMKFFSMDNPDKYKRKVCPCVVQEADSCKSIEVFQSTTACQKFK